MLRRSSPPRYTCALGESPPRASLAHARKLMTDVRGMDLKDLASSFSTLAGVRIQQGKYEKALELYQKSLDIIIRDVAAVYNNMSCVYYKQKKYDEALALYARSLDIFVKTRGLDDFAGKHEEALDLRRKSQAIKMKWVVEDY
ncbi:hypothetical protein T484DRAFT_1800116 [Baffinella frigidus]|nr:hypothetical protein T484DRAFT_1800116 [Cryptophyta sp. CCMP2293]